MTTLCLCMIVKDEAAIIERCLRSVRPFISTWVIRRHRLHRRHAGRHSARDGGEDGRAP
jgi:hypothetical protein